MTQPTPTTARNNPSHSALHNFHVDVKMFGAVGDGVTDDTTAIQSAITASGTGGRVFFPRGTYRITATLSVTSSQVVLAGAGRWKTQLHLESATTNAITVANTSVLEIRDMAITCFSSSNTRTAGRGISLTTVGDYLIENVSIRSGWDAIYLSGAATGILRNVTIDDSASVTGGGLNRGIIMADTCISTRMEDVHLSATNSASAAQGILVDSGTDTLNMIGVEIVTGFNPQLQIANNGVAHDARWVRLSNCYFDSPASGAHTVEILKGYDIQLDQCYVKGGQSGIHLSSTNKLVTIKGGMVLLAQQYGILVDATTDLLVDGVTVADNSQQTANTYSGIAIAPNVSAFRLVNNRCGNLNVTGGASANHKYGITVIAGTSNNYIIANNDVRTNTTGGLNDGGSGGNKTVTGNIT